MLSLTPILVLACSASGAIVINQPAATPMPRALEARQTVDTSALSASISSYRASASSFYAANSGSIESSRSSQSSYFSSVIGSITANSPTVTTTPGECQGADDDKGVEVGGQCCRTGFFIDGKCYDAKGFNGSVIENNGVGTISEYGDDDDDDDSDSDSEGNDSPSSSSSAASLPQVSSSPTGASSSSSSSSSTPDDASRLAVGGSLLGFAGLALTFTFI